MKIVIIITILFVFLFIPIYAYESVSDLKNEFESSMIEINSVVPTDKDLEDWRIYLGEERYQKLEEFNAKYETGFNSETSLSLKNNMVPTLDDEIFMAEIVEDWLKFSKQKINKIIIKIENSFENVKSQINESDLSEEEKFLHINEIEEKKMAYVSIILNDMKDLVLLEDEITQKKNELQLQSNLREQLLELESEICPPGTTIGIKDEMVICQATLDTEKICPVGTQPEFDYQGNFTCRNIDENEIVDFNREILSDLEKEQVILDGYLLEYIGMGTVALILVFGFYHFEKYNF